jgi:hypothetical protein
MPGELPTYESLPDYLIVCYERWFTHLYEPEWARKHPLAHREGGLLLVPTCPHIGGPGYSRYEDS